MVKQAGNLLTRVIGRSYSNLSKDAIEIIMGKGFAPETLPLKGDVYIVSNHVLKIC